MFNSTKNHQKPIAEENTQKRIVNHLGRVIAWDEKLTKNQKRIAKESKERCNNIKENNLAKIQKVEVHKKLEKDDENERDYNFKEKWDIKRNKEKLDKQEFKKYIEQIKEKKKLHIDELKCNRNRMRMMDKIRAYSVFEKHTKKANYLKGLQEQRGSLFSN